MSGRTETQAAAILAYLKRHGTITASEALSLCGTFRLSARIYDLKERGCDIWAERVSVEEDGKEVGHYARYHYRGELKEG